MAKEDFCFTYYDGDAARDTTHMNRLERGAYHDLVISQRKFGHLTLDQAKKILGKDFADCWPAIELILKVDTDGRFFIEWLETSITKAKKHSKKQSENVTKRYQTSTNNLPENILVTPLGDGNEDGYGNEDLKTKKESEKFEYTLTQNDEQDDETLVVVKMWTSDIITGNDYKYKVPPGIDTNTLHALARDHLGKCARYGWHKNMTTQQAFRESLTNFLADKKNHVIQTTPKNTIADRKKKFEQS